LNNCEAVTQRVTGADSINDISEERQLIRRLTAHCHAYKGAEVKLAVFQLITTGLLFFGLLGLMFAAFGAGLYWASALMVLPAAGLLVRLFIIQHDCGHGSFFRSRIANDMTGRIISLFTFTPYGFWKTAHNMHHASSGNLNRRGIGSIDTLTVREYQALPARKKFFYRLYRNPVFLLLVATPFHILFLQRLPVTQSPSFFEDYPSVPAPLTRQSILSLDLAIGVFYGLATFLLGWKAVLAVYLPVVIATACIGGWLFFIQHQFEDTYWERDGEWGFSEAALMGSSYYVLPRVFQWFTGSIGLHHIHHLCALIPNYRLQKCLDGSRELQEMNRMTFAQSLKCVWWALWDEEQSRMVRFRDLKAARQGA
jgi:acyl-lipid omega-6 desaturase (Delta-12 desaturase)